MVGAMLAGQIVIARTAIHDISAIPGIERIIPHIAINRIVGAAEVKTRLNVIVAVATVDQAASGIWIPAIVFVSVLLATDCVVSLAT